MEEQNYYKHNIRVSDTTDTTFCVFGSIGKYIQSSINTKTEYIDPKYAQNESENKIICGQKNSDPPSDSEKDVSVVSDASGASEDRNKRIVSGLDFILTHFEEPLWPRTVSTAATKKRGENVQYPVDYKDRALLFYEGSPLRQDCRISGFRAGQTNPDLLFIDLDLKGFKGRVDLLNRALTKILKTIARKLDGAKPTVIWSGNGYHIILPIECPYSLAEDPGLKEYLQIEPDLSKEFLKFAEKYLTGGKACDGHSASLKSCMLRVPGSINTKNGKREEVRIIQRWDCNRPDYRLLLSVFHAHLAELKASALAYTNSHNNNRGNASSKDGTTVFWVEKLLQTPLDDWRKVIVDLILSRYLIVDRSIEPKQAYKIIMDWLNRCSVEKKQLDFKPHERALQKIRKAQECNIKHMGLVTMKKEYPELFDYLRANGVPVMVVVATAAEEEVIRGR